MGSLILSCLPIDLYTLWTFWKIYDRDSTESNSRTKWPTLIRELKSELENSVNQPLQSSISPSTIGEAKKLGLVLKSHGNEEETEGEEDAPDDGGEQVDAHVAVGEYQPLRLLQLLIQKALGK